MPLANIRRVAARQHRRECFYGGRRSPTCNSRRLDDTSSTRGEGGLDSSHGPTASVSGRLVRRELHGRVGKRPTHLWGSWPFLVNA
eukprot:scaffold154110_cov28-Tisochrysis_lutea.AAC.1